MELFSTKTWNFLQLRACVGDASMLKLTPTSFGKKFGDHPYGDHTIKDYCAHNQKLFDKNFCQWKSDSYQFFPDDRKFQLFYQLYLEICGLTSTEFFTMEEYKQFHPSGKVVSAKTASYNTFDAWAEQERMKDANGFFTTGLMGGALTTSRGALTTTTTDPETRRLELQLQIELSRERREKAQLFGQLGLNAKDITGQLNSSFYDYADKLRQDVSGTGNNMIAMPSGAATTDRSSIGAGTNRSHSFMLTGAGTDGIMTPAKAKFEFESDGQWKPVGRKGTIDGKSKIKAAGRASANSNRSNNANADCK
mmetsp:Transcript_45199/g.110087  ORF Transcript_45199/g.110087 Transcript_45199/m.110087 type:complete len:308 (+) Transcript_45199:473-1396(+)